MPNFFDDIFFDVPKLLKEQEKKPLDNLTASLEGINIFIILKDLICFYWFAFLMKTGLLRRAIYANIFIGWFDEFKKYWENYLQGRPLELPEFFYLKGVYRAKAQDISLPQDASLQEQLTVWQKPSTIYCIFNWQYRYAFNPLMYKYIKLVKHGDKVLEYGCGIAPVTNALHHFKRYLNIRVTCVDIPTIWLHFTNYRFKSARYINVMPLDYNGKFAASGKYNIIFCREVFEHLPNPIETVKYFWELLEPNGVLVFDYEKTEGKGLDTASSQVQRSQVLNFILEKFTIIAGSIPSNSDGITFAACRKK